MSPGAGKRGEAHIARWMEKRGYRVVAQNYHSRFGEIDIIAEKGAFLVFVEVKTREEGSLVSPYEAIIPGKQRKIAATAQDYLVRHPTSLQPRFDAAAVFLEGGRIVGQDYLENAFSV